MMQELIKVDAQPAKLEVNFEELKNALIEDLKKYEVVVTADTVGDAKKLATELNKTKQVIDQRRKQEVAKASAPIKAFDDNMKELQQICQDGRKRLLAQVETFENEIRELARDLLTRTRADLWDQYLVDGEFRRAEIDDLIKLTSVTGKGNLSKSAGDAVEARVRDDEALQNKVKLRLTELRAASFEAGLRAPLQRSHVEHFLFEDDATYQARLQRVLDTEVERQNESDRRLREQQEREAAQAEANRRADEERKARMAEQEAQAQAESNDPPPWEGPDTFESEAKPQEASGSPRQKPEGAVDDKDRAGATEPAPQPRGGKVAVTVVATFHTEVDARVSDDAIAAELRKRMTEAGMKSLSSVAVYRKQEAAA